MNQIQGSTGETFSAVYLYIHTRRPESFILENVVGLRTYGQDKIIIEKLQASNFFVVAKELNPLMFGLPQSQPRLFILGWRADDASMTAAQVEALAEEVPTNVKHLSNAILDWIVRQGK